MTQTVAQRPPTETALARFTRYAAIDTQSAEDVDTVPSTPVQWDLARLLVDELNELGAQDVWLSDTCIIYAVMPSNLEGAQSAAVPVVGLIAHMASTRVAVWLPSWNDSWTFTSRRSSLLSDRSHSETLVPNPGRLAAVQSGVCIAGAERVQTMNSAVGATSARRT